MTTLTINGKQLQVDLPDDTPILWTLRDQLGMTGTKFGCGMALCGACTVHLDGEAIRSCVTPIAAAAGKNITTIEAVSQDPVGSAIQQAWQDLGVPQCGYCQSGQIMSATALLHKNPRPSDQQIKDAMSGNICRCGTYTRIHAAIKRAALSQPLAPQPIGQLKTPYIKPTRSTAPLRTNASAASAAPASAPAPAPAPTASGALATPVPETAGVAK
jgi:isoquinoline 1-oxidoreductase alpha subunit